MFGLCSGGVESGTGVAGLYWWVCMRTGDVLYEVVGRRQAHAAAPLTIAERVADSLRCQRNEECWLMTIRPGQGARDRRCVAIRQGLELLALPR